MPLTLVYFNCKDLGELHAHAEPNTMGAIAVMTIMVNNESLRQISPPQTMGSMLYTAIYWRKRSLQAVSGEPDQTDKENGVKSCSKYFFTGAFHGTPLADSATFIHYGRWKNEKAFGLNTSQLDFCWDRDQVEDLNSLPSSAPGLGQATKHPSASVASAKWGEEHFVSPRALSHFLRQGPFLMLGIDNTQHNSVLTLVGNSRHYHQQ